MDYSENIISNNDLEVLRENNETQIINDNQNEPFNIIQNQEFCIIDNSGNIENENELNNDEEVLSPKSHSLTNSSNNSNDSDDSGKHSYEEQINQRKQTISSMGAEDEPFSIFNSTIRYQAHCYIYIQQRTIQSKANIVLEYIDEIEIPGQNIFMNRSTNTIQKITIDILIKKIIFKNFLETYSTLISAFYNQFYIFLTPDYVISKISSAFFYYKNKKTSSQKLLNLVKFLNQIIIELYIQHISSMTKFNNETIEVLNNLYLEILKDPVFSYETTKDIYNLLIRQTPQLSELKYFKNFQNKKPKDKIQYIKKFDSDKLNDNISKPQNTKPRSKSKRKPKAFYVLEWENKEIVEQLTIISTVELSLLQYKEFLGGKFMKKEKKTTSPTIIRISKRFDNLIMFVIQDILSYDHKRTRAKIIEKWISISHGCKAINNFNDSMAIIQALTHFIIQKLKKTWKYVSKHSKEEYGLLKELYSCDDNYRNLRNEINKCQNVPFVPYLGILLRDINFYEEKATYFENGRLINFEKISIVQDLIDNFYKFEDYAYEFQKNDKLLFFVSLLPIKEEVLEELGDKVEPKFKLYKKKKSEKRLTLIDEIFFK